MRVEFSLRDAFHMDYVGVLIADATHHAGPAAAQEMALTNIAICFGSVSTVADFCSAIGQSGI